MAGRAVSRSNGIPPKVANMLLATLSAILLRWLRPYQLDWLADRSRFKIGVMSRQCGKSEVISLEATLLALEAPKSPEQVVLLVSSGGFQAQELLRKVLRWTDLFDEAMRRVLGPGATIYARQPTTEMIELINGQRIVSHPANPRTLAGFTGAVFWDEAGRTAFDRQIFEAIMPISDEGPYPVRITGTPWGDSGVFYDLCAGGAGGGPALNWALHKVTLVDAVRMGLRRDIELIKSMYDPFTFAQDYMCEFTSTVNQVFPKELILDALDLELPAPKWDDRSIRRAMGIDVGRTHDKTSELWVAEHPEDYYQVERSQTLRNMPFNEQEAVIGKELAGGRISRALIDQTGLGMQMAENLMRSYPGIAEGVTFGPRVKEDLVSLTLSLMQSRRLKLLPDSDLISDISAIRQEFRPGGGIRYDAERTEKGHADSFWALALGLSALASVQPWRIAVVEGASAQPRQIVSVDFDGQRPADAVPGVSILSALSSYAPADSRAPELPTFIELGIEGDPFEDPELEDAYGLKY